MNTQQAAFAEAFHQLHYGPRPLVLPNIWEPLGAALLQDLGFSAVATSSSAIALTHGLQDGERISFHTLLRQIDRIVRAVSLPVTADIESGYAHTEVELEQHMEALLDTGIVGVNIEDSNKTDHSLISTETQVQKIRLIKRVAARRKMNLFVNARIDCYLPGIALNHEARLQECLRRGKAYAQAGADGLFPILLKDEAHIQTLTNEFRLPVNIMVLPGVPALKKLEALGVRRISFGSSFLKIAMQAMKGAALQWQQLEGLEAIEQNDITSSFLETLVDRRRKD